MNDEANAGANANNKIPSVDEGTMLISAVRDNMRGNTYRKKEQAEAARKLQNIVGRPFTKNYIYIVYGISLINCTVTGADIRNAEIIFGPNLGSLKGNTTRKKVTTSAEST